MNARRRGPPSRPSPSEPIPETEYLIYSDGGSEPNPGPGGWGAVVLKGGQATDLKGGDEETTNNRMELSGAIEALRSIPPGASAHVVTDSTYVKNGITKWIHNWVKRGWRKSDGEPVQNSDLWQDLFALTSSRDVSFSWTKGHAGNRWNERADVLATEGRRDIQRQLGVLRVPEPESSASSPAATAARATSLPAVSLAVGIAHSRKEGGAWTCILQSGEHEKVLTGKGESKAPNRLYLLAFQAGLEALKGPSEITLLTQLSYLSSGATQWIHGWARRGWKQKSGGEVAHSDLWQDLARTLDQHHLHAPDLSADHIALITRAKDTALEMIGKPKTSKPKKPKATEDE